MVEPAVRLAGKRDLDPNSESVTRQRRIDVWVKGLLKSFETREHYLAIREAIVESHAAHQCFIGIDESSGRIPGHCCIEQDCRPSSRLPLKVDGHDVVEAITAKPLSNVVVDPACIAREREYPAPTQKYVPRRLSALI